MVEIVVLAVIIGVVCVIEAVAYLLYGKKAPEGRKRILEFLLDGRIQPFTQDSQVMSQGAAIRYQENPFTAWSLNPKFVNIYGEHIHNDLGFRSSDDFNDNEDILRIYCAGGSTTYCTDIEQNDQTWPQLLGSYLGECLGTSVEVINGGVGGFNTFQSYIRLSAYIDHLRPDVVIVYHAKNDLNPFYHETSDHLMVLPDYSNSMKSLDLGAMSNKVNFLTRYSYVARLLAIWNLSPEDYSLSAGYHRPVERDVATYLSARLDYSIIDTMHTNMVSLCKGRSVPLIYMTQRVEDQAFAPFVQDVNARIRLLENQDGGCWVFDLDKHLSHDADLFVDKMHFTKLGCEVVAKHISDYLCNSKIVSRG